MNVAKTAIVVGVLTLSVGAGYLIMRSQLDRDSLKRPTRELKSLHQVELVDSKGRDIPLSRYNGTNRILYLGYSHCPDMCPMALSNLSRAMKDEPELRTSIQTIFVSVDPERDSPEQLSRYEKQFAPLPLVALTGKPDQIETLSTDLSAKYEKVPASGVPSMGEYGVNHSLFFYFIDKENRLVATLPSGISPQAIVDASKKYF